MDHDPALLAECRALAGAVARYPTLAALKSSAQWRDLGARLARVLARTRRYSPIAGPPPASQPDRLKALQWNIEHGNHYDGVERALHEHHELRDADVVFLNEADLGMARSGNRDVVGDLARSLGRHGVWAAMFLETTPGRDEDRGFAGTEANREGLFGLGLLSRWPIEDVRLVELPSPEAYQFDVERMLGRHVAIVATIDRPGKPFVAVAVHLEVHRTREHRAVQMRTVLEALAAEEHPVLIAGDFNSHTFNRGRLWDPLFGLAVLMFAPQRALNHRLLFPYHGRHCEPLFDELSRAAFRWRKLVDRTPTLQLRFDRIDELRAFPDFVQSGVRGALSWAERRGRLRLDWFAQRGFSEGRGYTVPGLDGPGGASDHAPIVCELW